MMTEYAVEIFKEGWVQPETGANDDAGIWATEILAAAWLERKFRATRDAMLKSSGRLIDREDFLRHSKAIVALTSVAEMELVVHNLMNPERKIEFGPVQLQSGPPVPAMRRHGGLSLGPK